MKNVFVISDLHLSHAACIFKFKKPDGTPLRDFKSVEEMDELIIHNWNRVVKPGDRVYNLGDITMKRQFLHLLNRLNGNQVLIKGNHDIFKLDEYYDYFDDIRATHKMKNLVFSHYPIHPESLGNNINVHGHTHWNLVTLPNGKPDERYVNVCVERIGYTPIPLEELQKGFKNV